MSFRTSTIIERIALTLPDFENRVYGTADEATAKEQKVIDTPTAWCFAMGGKALPNITIGAHNQLVTVYFGVMIAVRNVAGKGGASGADVLEPLRDQLHEKIVGWLPDGMEMPCDYVLDRSIGYDKFLLRWVDVFSTQYYRRKP